MSAPAGRRDAIVFDNVSKFYGEVLGINRVDLSIPPGITSLVGPNGSGKSTLMNLLAGLLEPSEGRIEVLGLSPRDPERLFSLMGYCTQVDSFPAGMTGRSFLRSYLQVHGFESADAARLADAAIERVSMTDAADRKISAYSKGMRQRIKLAQSIAHGPQVLILDEPLNGLDPMARAQVIELFRDYATEGRHLLISSHILHEVDMISDQVVLMNQGYVVAEGAIKGVREEMVSHPIKILVRCDRPNELAARVFEHDSVVEARVFEEGGGLLLSTKNAERFHLLLNKIIVDGGFRVETVAPADDDVQAVYDYLIGGGA